MHKVLTDAAQKFCSKCTKPGKLLKLQVACWVPLTNATDSEPTPVLGKTWVRHDIWAGKNLRSSPAFLCTDAVMQFACCGYWG